MDFFFTQNYAKLDHKIPVDSKTKISNARPQILLEFLSKLPLLAKAAAGFTILLCGLLLFTYVFTQTQTDSTPAVTSVRVFRGHVSWVDDNNKIDEPMTFQSNSLLPPNITACKGFGFACLNDPNNVIGTYQRCDGVKQCADGSDEIGCSKCQTSLSCASKNRSVVCLRGNMLCDKTSHCANAADEITFCAEDCSDGSRKCKKANICLSNSMICDGDPHCPDMEDEISCSECQNGAKFCRPLSTCIPKWHLCDGSINCPDATDELDCDCKGCSGSSKLLCDGQVKMCLDKFALCNGKRDCPQGEDEKNCIFPMP